MANLPALLFLANRLKDTRRAGWVRSGAADAESVADHSWGVAMLVLLLAPPELNRERLLALAVAHDLAEAITGDITPHDGVLPDIKHAREDAAMRQFSALAGNDSLWQLWREYSANTTPEAGFVHELDAMEMAAQAVAYEHNGRLRPAECDSFLRSAAARIHRPALREHLASLLAGAGRAISPLGAGSPLPAHR